MCNEVPVLQVRHIILRIKTHELAPRLLQCLLGTAEVGVRSDVKLESAKRDGRLDTLALLPKTN